MAVESAQDDRELVERGWSALPAEYRIPEQRPTLEEARAYCQRLATTHYENFHVASWFLPARLRPHFYSIYAYCRIADDLGDEVGNREQSLALLDLWGRELDACYRGEARHPVFVALAETIRACDIPQQPFADLLVAFRQDQNVLRYQTMDDVLDYCKYSANPVGRLVLYACGYRAQEMFLLSDFTCTALQLANFWQDVSSDYARGRIYLPLQDMERYGVDEATIARREPTPAFRELLRYEVDYARQLFHQGMPLIAMVDRELALDLDLFSRGGLEILARHRPPAIRRAHRASGDLKEQEAGAGGARSVRQAYARVRKGKAVTAEVQAAYAACRAIARKKAKNFYYAFVALPASKRDAICAVYAFMRQADDLSDDESLPIADRRVALDAWLGDWHRAQAGAGTSDPVFVALLDAQRSFAIPSQLLDQLVQGTATDLEPRPAAYATFADLYRYCYLVASVVGLVCIRIFGYLDPRAEKLAEETGIAFQLTNILRDVREDAQRGRLYLPLEDLDRCGVAANSITRNFQWAPIDATAAAGAGHSGGACGAILQIRGSVVALDFARQPGRDVGSGHHLPPFVAAYRTA